MATLALLCACESDGAGGEGAGGSGGGSGGEGGSAGQLTVGSAVQEATVVGTLETPGRALSLDVQGTRAYVGDYDHGLTIVDVSDPAKMTIIGGFEMADDVRGVAIFGDRYAALAAGNAGLVVADVGDPVNPYAVASVELPTYAMDVEVDGTTAWVAIAFGGVAGIDLSDPAKPQLLSVYDTGPGAALAGDTELRGSTLYVADGFGGLLILDVSDPTSPQRLGRLDRPGAARDVEVVGDIAFVADLYFGMRIVDVSDPTDPVLISKAPSLHAPEALVVHGDQAFMVAALFPLAVYDISDPATPLVTCQVSGTDGAHELEISGQIAFLAHDDSLRAVELCQPTEATTGDDLPALSAAGPVCGNGKVDGDEECDDGDRSGNDGCDASCRVEPGWSCRKDPSDCEPAGLLTGAVQLHRLSRLFDADASLQGKTLTVRSYDGEALFDYAEDGNPPPALLGQATVDTSGCDGWDTPCAFEVGLAEPAQLDDAVYIEVEVDGFVTSLTRAVAKSYVKALEPGESYALRPPIFALSDAALAALEPRLLAEVGGQWAECQGLNIAEFFALDDSQLDTEIQDATTAPEGGPAADVPRIALASMSAAAGRDGLLGTPDDAPDSLFHPPGPGGPYALDAVPISLSPDDKLDDCRPERAGLFVQLPTKLQTIYEDEMLYLPGRVVFSPLSGD